MLRTGIAVVACAAVLRSLQLLAATIAKRKANRGRAIYSPDETGARTFVLDSSKNVQLYCRCWAGSEDPDTSIVFVHNEFLDGGHFKKVAEQFCRRRFVCYSIDLTGFGKSGCQRGSDSHIDSYTNYLDDIDDVVEVVKAEQRNRPIVLYGEGLGATCAIAYALRHETKDKIHMVVANSPMLEPPIPSKEVEGLLHYITTAFSSTVDGPREELPYDIADLFDGAETSVVAAMNFRQTQPATVNKIKEIGALAEFVDEQVYKLSKPILILHGENDKRNRLELSEKLKDKIGAESKFLRKYPASKHGIMYGDESIGEAAINDIVGFVSRHSPMQTSES